MKKYNIPEHWDLTGQITAHSDPYSEFQMWKQWADQPLGANKNDWRGDEFTLADFESYIESLKKNQDLENFS